MILNSFDDKKIKILIDEKDLSKSGIAVDKLIKNSEKIFFIEKILSSSDNFVQLPKELVITNYFILTYNYKIFMIILEI